MEKLRECPFCGSEAIIYEDHEYNDAYMVGCKGFCKVEPMTEWCKTKEEAIAQWNTRKPMDKILELLERPDNYTIMCGKHFTTVERAIDIVRGKLT